MKIVNETLHLETRGFCHVIDVTEAVAAALAQTGMANGQALLFVVGATGGITTVEYEPGLLTVPIQDGRLRLGVWQQIVVIDFDNKSRQRKVALQFLGE